MEENNTAVDMQDNQSLDGQNSQEKSAQEKRGGFTSKIGFVLAAAGSAVGLEQYMAFSLSCGKIRRRNIFAHLHYFGGDVWLCLDDCRDSAGAQDRDERNQCFKNSTRSGRFWACCAR